MTQPSVGDLLYLASYLIRVRVNATSTPPDTPDQYGADLHVMGDQGAIALDALVGPTGPGGQQSFAFRQQDDAYVNSPQQLPPGLQDIPQDIGKYYLIDTLDFEGVVTTETAWTWYGTAWRAFTMGVKGKPGAVPAIDVTETLIPPGQDSYVATSGTTLEPTWDLHLAEPAGRSGPIGPLYLFDDVDTSTPAAPYDLLAFSGFYTEAGTTVWAPFSMTQLLPRPYSVPESAFTAFNGFTQRALVCTFTVPAQPYEWTPIVWGHLGATGINLSSDPFMIGCQVLLNDPDPAVGIQVGRGLGSTLGRIVVMPHYSTGANKANAITPTNQYAMVPAHTAATIFTNLWNDGQHGLYFYQPGGSQLFIWACPVNIAAQLAGGGP